MLPVQDPASLNSATRSATHATLSGDVAIAPACRRIRVATGGNIVLTYADGTVDTITGLLDGESIDVIATKITQSGTTALGITIFW